MGDNHISETDPDKARAPHITSCQVQDHCQSLPVNCELHERHNMVTEWSRKPINLLGAELSGSDSLTYITTEEYKKDTRNTFVGDWMDG